MVATESRPELLFSYEGIADVGLLDTLEVVAKRVQDNSLQSRGLVKWKPAQSSVRQALHIPNSEMEALVNYLIERNIINPVRDERLRKSGKPLTVTPDELLKVTSIVWGYKQVLQAEAEGEIPPGIIATACNGLGTHPLAESLLEVDEILNPRQLKIGRQEGDPYGVIKHDENGRPCFTPEQLKMLSELRGEKLRLFAINFAHNLDDSAEPRKAENPIIVAFAYSWKVATRGLFPGGPENINSNHVIRTYNAISRNGKNLSVLDIYEKACIEDDNRRGNNGTFKVFRN